MFLSTTVSRFVCEGDTVKKFFHGGSQRSFRCHRRDRRLQAYSFAVKQLVSLMKYRNVFAWVTVSFQSDRVECTRLPRIAFDDRKRRRVLRQSSQRADKTELPDTRELNDAATAGDGHVVADSNVAAEHTVIRDHDPIADAAIVSDVRVDHEVVVVTDVRDAVLLFGGTIHGAVLAKNVVVPDGDSCGGVAIESCVLGETAEDAALKHLVIFTQRGVAGHAHMFFQNGPITDFCLGADHAEVTDANVRAQLGPRVDDRGLSDNNTHDLEL